jgi:two-component system, OmpR family, response regulator CpxR
MQRRGTALIVEDDPRLAITLCDALNDEGYASHACTTLGETIAAIAECDPAVVVLDLTLQREFGGDLLEHLATREHSPAVVVCSAFPLASIVAARYGVPCVAKPFELDLLLETVQRAVDEQTRPAA